MSAVNLLFVLLCCCGGSSWISYLVPFPDSPRIPPRSSYRTGYRGCIRPIGSQPRPQQSACRTHKSAAGPCCRPGSPGTAPLRKRWHRQRQFPETLFKKIKTVRYFYCVVSHKLGKILLRCTQNKPIEGFFCTCLSDLF